MRDFSVLILSLLSAMCQHAVASRFPIGAWDTHIHVIDPERFPLEPDREYTPKPATKQNASDFQEARGIQHAVIIQPSVYGFNNSALLDALKFFKGQYSGVAVVDPDNVTDEELDELNEAGVRGLRLNYGNDGVPAEEILEIIKKNAKIAEKYDWALEIWVPLSAFETLHDYIKESKLRRGTVKHRQSPGSQSFDDSSTVVSDSSSCGDLPKK